MLEVDQGEAEAAKARLDAQRAQRRARYAKNRGGVRVPLTPEEKKAKRRARDTANRENRNARDRARYALKKSTKS